MNSNPNDKTANRGNESTDKVDFKCSDVGPKNCDWKVSGNSEQEIIPKIEQHGREKHNMTIDEKTKDKVRNAIHHHQAA